MKRVIRNLMSLLLMLLMVFATNGTAFAAERVSAQKQAQSIDEAQIAREAYQNLTSEAKEIFEASLANDAELLEFHKSYVDPDFKATSSNDKAAYSAASTYSLSSYSVTRASASTSDSMAILTAQLAAIALPTAVAYAAQAMGAGMVAAIADGPLPIGDILLIAASVSFVVVVIASWDEMISYWNSVVTAFKVAFPTFKANVTSAFDSLFAEVQTATQPDISVDGQELTINGVIYYCTTRADQLTTSQKNGKKYMPAVLFEDHVWVAAEISLAHNQALLIAQANNWNAGVWATTKNYARGLCQNGTQHGPHGSEGYYPHYHHPLFESFHCWYLG